MEKYINLEVIGKGSFGEVVKAQNKDTKEIVAIKTMKQKFVTWEECMNLRELKSLRKLVNKNIVKLKEVLRVQNQLSFVFEYLDTDIYKLYENQKKLGQRLTETQLRSIFYQLAQSLSYMHKHGYFHRDLKPENILYSNKDGYVKLTDFGLAREIRSRPPYTDYVATRWYRAPELILRATNYNSPVDIFALGCIMAELYMFKPLFNGSSQLDQLQKITSVLGTPSKLDWPEGYRLAGLQGITFPSYPSIPLNQVITDCPYEAVQLIGECLKWDPQKRPTAAKILQHPYFKGVESVLPAGYFNDQEETKVNQQQTIHQGSGNPSNNDLNLSFGNEDSSKQGQRNSFSQQSNGGNQQVLTNKDNSSNNVNNTGGNQLLKKMSNQFSQSDVSITNKLKGVNNFQHSDYKSAKALELDSISEISNNISDPSQNKPPLNPNKVSRQNNRNQILKNQENTTPSFNERAKGKESGFNYSEFSTILDNRQQNNNSASKQQRATSLQQNNNDFFFGNQQQNQNNSLNNNYNTSQTTPHGPSLNQNNNNSTSNNNIYNFANINVNTRHQSPSPYPNQNTKQTTNNNQWDSEKNDILGTYLPSSINNGGPNHQARGSYHNYSNTQAHPRQQQQISSAVEKRSSNSIPYNTINYNGNQGNANNSASIHSAFNGGVYQSSIETGSRPTRNLNSAAYFENKTNTYNNQDYNSQSVNGSYRDYQANNNNTKNFYGNSPSHYSDNSGYVPSAAQGGSSTGNNYSSNNTNNIYSFSNAANSNNQSSGYSLSNPIYGAKTNQTSNTTTNANALTNKNIYDFNHVRQPVRNLGLPAAKFDIKF